MDSEVDQLKWIAVLRHNLKEANGVLKARRGNFSHNVKFNKKDEVLFTDEEQAYKYEDKVTRSASMNGSQNPPVFEEKPSGKTMGNKAEAYVQLKSDEADTEKSNFEMGAPAKKQQDSCWTSFLKKIGLRKQSRDQKPV